MAKRRVNQSQAPAQRARVRITPDNLPAYDVRTIEELLSKQKQWTVPGMIMTDTLPKFDHINARSLAEAVRLLAEHGSRAALLAGGTDLLKELKNRSRPAQPELLINLKTVQPALNRISETATGLSIGSLATLRTIETHPVVREQYPILAEAAHASRALQYRNMATAGGDLCQREKCWYSRASGNSHFCYRKGGEDCFAVAGDHRYHSIFGCSLCYAVCPSDLAPALAALGATVHVVGVDGARSVPVADFFTPMGTVLGADEIVTEVRVPAPDAGWRGAVLKVGARNKFDPPLTSVAVWAQVEDGVCREARIALGGVSHRPWRATAAEAAVSGQPLTPAVADQAALAALSGAAPLSMNAYKADLVRALVRRALLKVAEPQE